MRYVKRTRKSTKPVKATAAEIEASLGDIIPSLQNLHEELMRGRPRVEDLPF